MTDPMRESHRMRDGAWWCAQHGRRECARDGKRTQSRCHGIAIAGLDACPLHSGKRRDVAKAEGRARLAALAWQADPDTMPVIGAGQAVMLMLQVTYARWQVYALQLKAQYEQDELPSAAGDERVQAGTAGLVGFTYSASPSVGVYTSGEAQRALVTIEAAERDKVVRYAKTAHDMGIAEAQVKLAEGQGQLLAAGLTRLVDSLGLSPEQHGLAMGRVVDMLQELTVGQVGA